MYTLTTLGLLISISASLLWAVRNQELQMIEALMEQLHVQAPDLELLSSSR